MTEEDLEKEAVEYTDSAEEKKHWSDENDSNAVFTREEVEQAYLACAEPREKRIEELEAQIEKMKQELDTAREDANRQEQWELYSVLNGIYNDNFEVTTSVSN